MTCLLGERFSGYPATFKYFDCQQNENNFDLTHVESRELSWNNRISVQRPPGVVDPAAHLLAKSEPQYQLSTPDLNTALANVDLFNGQCMDICRFYAQQRAQCEGAFMTGPNHVAYEVQRAFMWVDSIQADMQQDSGAMLNFNFMPLYRPTGRQSTDLLRQIPNFDLTTPGTPTPAFRFAYWLGPTFLNGVELKGVDSITVQPQITVQASPSSPHTFNALASITVRETVYRVRGLKVDEFTGFSAGLGGIPGQIDFYLQQADPTNTTADGRADPDSATSIRISASSGVVDLQTQSVQGTDDTTMELMIRLEGPPSVSLNASIPTNSFVYPGGGP